MSSGLCECGCGQPAPIAKYSWARKGWVRGQPKRFIVGHIGRTPESLANLAIARTKQRPNARGRPKRKDKRARWHGIPEDRGYETPCLIWQGAFMNGGYGTLCDIDRIWLAHRWTYEHERGPIPEGHHLHHLCSQRDCINTDHLQPLTASEHRRLHVAQIKEAAA